MEALAKKGEQNGKIMKENHEEELRRKDHEGKITKERPRKKDHERKRTRTKEKSITKERSRRKEHEGRITNGRIILETKESQTEGLRKRLRPKTSKNRNNEIVFEQLLQKRPRIE